ncbi:hypothetical protein AB0I90_31765 [Micromonospora wenchangensis]|uniref:hypothetical protein n=1 Tax=Micromonospora wenchangensis TaxID=1185415 RepID=UPI0033C56CBF
MSEQENIDAYTPPAPKLRGFGNRGSSLAGLVSADRTSAVSALTTPATGPLMPDDTESASHAPAATRAEAVPAAAEEPPTAGAGRTEAAPATPTRAASVPTTEETSTGRAPATGMPDLSVDLGDPAALAVSPTVLSVPAPLMARFERARRNSGSNTELVLDALRAHLAELPRLVADARRPAATDASEPFPWRASTQRRTAAAKVRRVQLPIRPLAGELQVIDTLVGWVGEQIGAGPRSLGGRITRSEVVVAALNAYLPADRPRGRRPRS